MTDFNLIPFIFNMLVSVAILHSVVTDEYFYMVLSSSTQRAQLGIGNWYNTVLSEWGEGARCQTKGPFAATLVFMNNHPFSSEAALLFFKPCALKIACVIVYFQKQTSKADH
jgi:hypothetical protein